MNNAVKRIGILAQFDANGGVPAHVLIHLERLRPDVERLVLVSNSPISPDARERAEAICDTVIERPNSGWDFGAWRHVILQEDMAQWDELVLTNSSIVGPFSPLSDLFASMRSPDHDFWGMVLSKEIRPHLQSFFLCFRQNVLISEAWHRFWSRMEEFSDKDRVIHEYELKLTSYLVDNGFRFDHVVQNKPFPLSLGISWRRPRGVKLPVPFDMNHANRSLDRPMSLIRDGMPYIKSSLLFGEHTNRFNKHVELMKYDYPWEEIEVHHD